MPIQVTRLEYSLDEKPYIIGAPALKYFNEILDFVASTRFINDFVGPSGSGKTHTMKEVAKEYARQVSREIGKECPVFYTTVDEETMKSSLFAGKTFENGSQVVMKACVGLAMELGGVACVDELTQGMPSLQSSLNAPGDRDSLLSIGDLMIVAHPNFRLFTGHNSAEMPGNVPILPATGSRFVVWPFDYPAPKVEARIAKALAMQQLGVETLSVPDGVIYYLVWWIREMRAKTNNTMPLSARNVSAMVCRMSRLARNFGAPVQLHPKYDVASSANEPFKRMIAKRIFFKDVATDDDLHHESVREALRFFSQIGEEKFRFVVKQCAMLSLDIAGIAPQVMRQYRAEMETSIL